MFPCFCYLPYLCDDASKCYKSGGLFTININHVNDCNNMIIMVQSRIDQSQIVHHAIVDSRYEKTDLMVGFLVTHIRCLESLNY